MAQHLSACAWDIVEHKFNDHRMVQAPESSSPGHQNDRRPLLLHAHYLLLYFFSPSVKRHIYVHLQPAAVFNHLLFALRLISSCPAPRQSKGKTAQAYVKLVLASGGGRAAPFRRTHEICWTLIQQTQDDASSCFKLARTSKPPMSATAFHAHYLLLYFLASQNVALTLHPHSAALFNINCCRSI